MCVCECVCVCVCVFVFMFCTNVQRGQISSYPLSTLSFSSVSVVLFLFSSFFPTLKFFFSSFSALITQPSQAQRIFFFFSLFLFMAKNLSNRVNKTTIQPKARSSLKRPSGRNYSKNFTDGIGNLVWNSGNFISGYKWYEMSMACQLRRIHTMKSE